MIYPTIDKEEGILVIFRSSAFQTLTFPGSESFILVRSFMPSFLERLLLIFLLAKGFLHTSYQRFGVFPTYDGFPLARRFL